MTTTPRIELRRLTTGDLDEHALKDFDRHQVTKRVRYIGPDGFAVKDDGFVDDWSDEKKARVVGELVDCIDSGGAVFGAFEGSSLVGFANVLAERFGSDAQYLEMPYMHVSKHLRGRGVGRELFLLAAKDAAERGATKLYIGTHPAVETQAFYDAVGCMPAAEAKPLASGEEPIDDVYLEYDLSDLALRPSQADSRSFLS